MFRSRRVYDTIGTLLCLAVLMAACGGQSPATPGPEQTDAPAAPSEPAAPTAQPVDTEFTSPLEQEVSPLPTPTEMTEGDTNGQTTEPVEIVLPGQDPATAPLMGEVPQNLRDAVFLDLAKHLGVSGEAITVAEAGVVVWRDGSLGCPQPGMMYTQALVPGYRIILSAVGETFDYHASDGGYFLLCEGALAEDPLPPDEGSGPLLDQ